MSDAQVLTNPVAAIWKFPLRAKHSSFNMPAAKIVHVADQDGIPCLWAMVRPNEPERLRTFTIIGTGEEFDMAWPYLGTTHSGSFVWHIFETTL